MPRTRDERVYAAHCGYRQRRHAFEVYRSRPGFPSVDSGRNDAVSKASRSRSASRRSSLLNAMDKDGTGRGGIVHRAGKILRVPVIESPLANTARDHVEYGDRRRNASAGVPRCRRGRSSAYAASCSRSQRHGNHVCTPTTVINHWPVRSRAVAMALSARTKPARLPSALAEASLTTWTFSSSNLASTCTKTWIVGRANDDKDVSLNVVRAEETHQHAPPLAFDANIAGLPPQTISRSSARSSSSKTTELVEVTPKGATHPQSGCSHEMIVCAFP